MKTKRLKFLISCAVTLFLVVPSSRAQVTIDMGKVTCAQFLKYSVADPDKIAIWLSGYQHGKRGDVIMGVQELKANVAKLKSACYKADNSQQPVMQVVEKLFFAK
jgi:acid stress chaperone HdeB